MANFAKEPEWAKQVIQEVEDQYALHRQRAAVLSDIKRSLAEYEKLLDKTNQQPVAEQPAPANSFAPNNQQPVAEQPPPVYSQPAPSRRFSEPDNSGSGNKTEMPTSRERKPQLKR